MNQAIRSVLQKYATFGGRASRSEYWYWILAFWIGWCIIIIFTHLFPLYDFGLLVPTLAVGVRRLHDTNHSGWWLVAFPYSLFLLTLPPVEPNRYGTDVATSTSYAPTYSPGPMVDTAPGVAPGSHQPPEESSPHPATPSTVCPSCATPREAGQNYCQSCGTKFD